MDGITISEPGGPEVLTVSTLDRPVPGERQVLVRVAGAGVNRPDCLQRAGKYPVPPGASPLPGLEISGEVVAVGSHAAQFSPGDRVAALTHGGGYAEYAVADERHCLPLTSDVDLVSAGAVAETLFTVYYNVWQRAKIKAGETLLVHGGSSGIGATAIQLARLAGCQVVTTAGSDEKCAFAESLGADLVVNYRTDDFVQAAKDKFGGVDVVLDMVGGDYIERNLQSLNQDGRYVFIAFLGGPKASINFLPFLRKRLTMTGSTLRPQTDEEKASIAEGIVRDCWPFVLDGRFRIPVFKRFALADASSAHALMESGQHMGKILLTTEFTG